MYYNQWSRPQLREDCPEGTYRINNYFKECWGAVYMCTDACYDEIRRHATRVGPPKTCGICIGFPYR